MESNSLLQIGMIPLRLLSANSPSPPGEVGEGNSSSSSVSNHSSPNLHDKPRGRGHHNGTQSYVERCLADAECTISLRSNWEWLEFGKNIGFSSAVVVLCVVLALLADRVTGTESIYDHCTASSTSGTFMLKKVDELQKRRQDEAFKWFHGTPKRLKTWKKINFLLGKVAFLLVDGSIFFLYVLTDQQSDSSDYILCSILILLFPSLLTLLIRIIKSSGMNSAYSTVTDPMNLVDLWTAFSGYYFCYNCFNSDFPKPVKMFNLLFLRSVRMFMHLENCSVVLKGYLTELTLGLSYTALRLLTIMAVGGTIIQVFEKLGDPPGLYAEDAMRAEPNTAFNSWFHAMYFSVITMSTVGYGDMSPVTVFGQVVCLIYVLVGITTFGIETSALVDLWSDGLKNGHRITLREKEFVFLCGELSEGVIRTFLEDYQ